MARLVAFLAAALLLTLVPPVTSAAPTTGPATQPQHSGPLPLPSEAELTASRKLVREVYPADLSRKSAADRRLLASKMLDVALETKDSPGERYVMLQEAMNLAAGAGDAEIVTKAADAMEAGYLCDAAIQRADALAKCESIAPSKELSGRLAAADVAAALQSADNDDYDAATKYSQKALAAARALDDRTFLSVVQSHLAAIREERARFLQLRSAFEKLKSEPNDPASNLAVGQYLCFTKGKWESGLPHLAKGSDAGLKQVAQNEISASPEPQVKGDLAEQWWNVADQNPHLPRKPIEAHAAELYRQALPGLGGLARAVAQRRIDQVASETMPVEATLKPPEIVSVPKPSVPREILGDLIGGTREPDGTLQITQRTRVRSQETFKPPVAFRIVAQTDSTNIRIKYAASQIIFDWEVNPTELRVDGGPASGRHKKGAGFIEPGAWAQIDLVVLPDAMIIVVNGQERYRTSADFSEVDQPFGLFTTGNAILQLKSVLVRTP